MFSKFQRFHTKTEEKAASVIKMFVLQFINTVRLESHNAKGIVILLVNARISQVSLPAMFPIFAGQYTDFTVDWYRVVGTTITLTMMLNIVSPHIGAFVKIFMRAVTKCCDRSCTTDKRRTKKLLQSEYDSLYIGPEFLIEVRYSQVLTSIYIMMLYSSGMPLLYVVAMV